MHESSMDSYRGRWSARDYLKQYYSNAHVAEDEIANFRFAARNLANSARKFRRAIEVGCGPTLHHALALAAYAEEIHLADYLSSNLAECRRALNEESGCHDWSQYARGMFGDAAVENLRLLRDRVSRLFELDIRKPQQPSYDLVASYYCAEAVAGDYSQWEKCLKGLADLVLPGGFLLIGALRNCTEYRVFENTFPNTCVDEDDFATILPKLGFNARTMIIESVAIEKWTDQGFDSICCVWAEKCGPRNRHQDGVDRLNRVDK